MDADQQPEGRERFRDPRGRVEQFARFDVLVVCPRCGGCGVSRSSPQDNPWLMWWPRRVSCLGCGYADDWPRLDGRARSRGVADGAEVDPHFWLPLWLRASCCGGNRLWAWNAEHLDVLESYIGARLRERGALERWGSTSMLEKLPAWMKTAKNRDELLKVTARLRTTLPPPLR
jgi:hypothetical protein